MTGGGLRQSAGVLELRRTKEYWRGNERILDDGDFVNEVLKLSEEELTHKEELKRQGWDLNRIVNEVCRMLIVTFRSRPAALPASAASRDWSLSSR